MTAACAVCFLKIHDSGGPFGCAQAQLFWHFFAVCVRQNTLSYFLLYTYCVPFFVYLYFTSVVGTAQKHHANALFSRDAQLPSAEVAI